MNNNEKSDSLLNDISKPVVRTEKPLTLFQNNSRENGFSHELESRKPEFINLKLNNISEKKYFQLSIEKKTPIQSKGIQSNLEKIEEDYFQIMGQFKQVYDWDSGSNQDEIEFEEKLIKQKSKLIKILLKMNDILNDLIENQHFYIKKKITENKIKKDKMISIKSNRINKHSYTIIGEHNLTNIFKNEYNLLLMRLQKVSETNYLAQIEENLRNINNEIDSMIKENRDTRIKQKGDEYKISRKFINLNTNNSSLGVLNLDIDSVYRQLQLSQSKIEKNKTEINSNEALINQMNESNYKLNEIAIFYGYSDDNKKSSLSSHDYYRKISLDNKYYVINTAILSNQRKYQAIIKKREIAIFQLNNIKEYYLDQLNTKINLSQDITGKVNEMYKFVEFLQKQLQLKNLIQIEKNRILEISNIKLKNIGDFGDNENVGNCNTSRKDEIKKINRPTTNVEGILLYKSLENAKKIINEFRENQNIEVENDNISERKIMEDLLLEKYSEKINSKTSKKIDFQDAYGIDHNR